MTDAKTKSRYADLIERLEAAEGPDVRLDADIEQLINERPKVFFSVVDARYLPQYGCPKWTESIDAALTLVPDNAVAWSLGDSPGGPTAEVLCDGTFQGFPKPGHGTPALALSIAALRAREAAES